jgi:uncharacterized protein YbjT (DUF2867 family)
MAARESSSAVVIGATGLVGRECLEQLVAQPEFDKVTALARRALPGDLRSPKLRTVLVDFDRLDDRPDRFGASHLFCALGTTLKKAGSRERFRQVDFEYSLKVAELARSAGVRHFLLVSTAGADPASRAFYLRVKGELEREITALAFRSTTVVRPSWLVGNRGEFRLREEIPLRLAWALPRKYRPVRARDVASALVAAAVADRPGLRVIENPEVSRRSVRPERSGDFGGAGGVGTVGTEGERK